MPVNREISHLSLPRIVPQAQDQIFVAIFLVRIGRSRSRHSGTGLSAACRGPFPVNARRAPALHALRSGAFSPAPAPKPRVTHVSLGIATGPPSAPSLLPGSLHDRIFEVVAVGYGVSTNQIKSRTGQTKQTYEARHVATCVARALLGCSTTKLGQRLHGRNANSVTSLTPHQSAILACFVFWWEICHPAGCTLKPAVPGLGLLATEYLLVNFASSPKTTLGLV